MTDPYRSRSFATRRDHAVARAGPVRQESRGYPSWESLAKFNLTLSAALRILIVSIRSGSACGLNPATGLGDATVP